MSTEPRFVYRADHPHGPNVIDRSTGKWMGIDLARQYAAVVNAVDATPVPKQAQPDDALHTAICQAVTILNVTSEPHKVAQANGILLPGLFDYVEPQPVPEQAQPAGVTKDERDAARYRAIRAAGSGLKLYYYDDIDDPCSGDWMYKPSPEWVDRWADAARAQEGEKP